MPAAKPSTESSTNESWRSGCRVVDELSGSSLGSSCIGLFGRLKRALNLRACLKIGRDPATRNFGPGQGGEAGASPQRAVTAEPTPGRAKRTVARRVFAEKAGWLRCSSVTDRWRVCSLVAPRHPAFSAKTGPLRIFRQALRRCHKSLGKVSLGWMFDVQCSVFDVFLGGDNLSV